MDLTFLPSLICVHAAATISPGPNFALIFETATTSKSRSKIMGLVAGIGTGISFHCALALFGLSMLLAENQNLLTAVKFLGAIYLMYLGCCSLKAVFLKSGASKPGPQEIGDGRFLSSYLKGVASCILNPKVFLYYASVFPQAIPNVLSTGQSLVTLSVLTAIPLTWYSILASAVSKLSAKQINIYRTTVRLITGCLFVFLSMSIVLEFFWSCVV